MTKLCASLLQNNAPSLAGLFKAPERTKQSGKYRAFRVDTSDNLSPPPDAYISKNAGFSSWCLNHNTTAWRPHLQMFTCTKCFHYFLLHSHHIVSVLWIFLFLIAATLLDNHIWHMINTKGPLISNYSDSMMIKLLSHTFFPLAFIDWVRWTHSKIQHW